MSDPVDQLKWGVVPEPVRVILQRLRDRAASATTAMDTASIKGVTPRNHDDAFLRMSASAEAADRATRDYRSVFNAYTHRFHTPKPPIGGLAAMQGVVTQSFAKRYTPKTIAAIEALLSDSPDLDAIRHGIRALGFNDLWGVSDALDNEMRLAEANPRFRPWLPTDEAIRTVQNMILDAGGPGVPDDGPRKQASSRARTITGFEDIELPPPVDQGKPAARPRS